jgi:hypothetical protein
MTDTLRYPKGSIMVMTTGEYSDFRVCGFLVAVQDCDLPALAQAFHAERMAELEAEGNADWDTPDPNDFPSWLVAKGHAMPVDAHEIHLGGYGEFEPEFGTH